MVDPGLDSIPLKVHDPGVLAEESAPLLKIVRRLRRPHPSRTRLTLDVDRTVERWTETGSLLPVEGPVNELWLEAVLVVDTTRSAFLWRSAADDLAVLLVRSGAFRKVRRVDLGPGGRLEQRGRLVARPSPDRPRGSDPGPGRHRRG